MPGASQWPAFTSTVFLVRRHTCDVVATHCGGDVTLTASNWPVWIPKLKLPLYSCCCPLLYPSPPTGSISSCLQLTLTEVTHLMDPRSGSLVTLGHTARNSNMCDVISNGISGSHSKNKDRPFVCEKCGQDFHQWMELNIHLRQKHPKVPGDRSGYFQCPNCTKEFHTYSRRRKHVQNCKKWYHHERLCLV